MNPFCVVIPAVKKNVAFADDLVKKLNRIPLIQRTINRAKQLTHGNHIYVVTDSQEISLICERSGVRYVYRRSLNLAWDNLLSTLQFFLLKLSKRYEAIIALSPYSPLVIPEDVQKGYQEFIRTQCDVLVTVRDEVHRLFRKENNPLRSFLADTYNEPIQLELRAFIIVKSKLLQNNNSNPINLCPYVLDSQTIEITDYKTWWVCDKLLKRKRIIFRVIGYNEVGMGHILRTLSLAHEISDHEIIFICEERSGLAVNVIAGYDYPVEVCAEDDIDARIISLKPSMVINDILDTDSTYIQRLQKNKIAVVNFEDLGSGANQADLTINELYDKACIDGKSIRWGYRYFFLRDEFTTATPHRFNQKISSLLITFGGTDQNNYTMKTLRAVIDICSQQHIKIFIVAGAGYSYAETMESYLDTVEYKNIEYTCATGVISKIMEKTQIAIASNGRTVYELAHMNIPAVVISQHGRENSHNFACEENGFINIAFDDTGISEDHLKEKFLLLLNDGIYRKKLFDATKRFNFARNKNLVVNLIHGILEKESGDQ